MRMLPQFRWKNWEPFIFFSPDKPEFSKSECKSIIHLAKTLKPEVAMTASGDSKTIRSSEVYWMKRTKQSKWIFDRLASVCARSCPAWYPFHLSGFAEAIQITHYFAEGDHYDWHHDFGAEAMSTRKLSLVTLLSDPTKFKGGDLEMMSIPGKEKAVRPGGTPIQQGTTIVFPAWEQHRVVPLTEGERWSMVCWVHGHPFT